jgi:tetratricopeptide (TPR) repeat protein
MSFLRRWFGAKDGPSRGRGGHQLAQQVRELERQAEDAPLGTRATLLNRAGDVCMRAGDHPRALEYFRLAIDLLLEDEQPEPARGVAKKIIRVHPETVRTHCTLTWLDLATRQDAGAAKSLRDYVNAAERHGQIDQAGQEILEMARIASHRGFLEEAAQHLKAMGFPRESDQVMEWASAGGAPEAGGDPQELSRRCLTSAIDSKFTPRRDRTRS